MRIFDLKLETALWKSDLIIKRWSIFKNIRTKIITWNIFELNIEIKWNIIRVIQSLIWSLK